MPVRLTAIALSALALAASAVTLIGWWAGRMALTDWDGDGIAMFPNTALAAIAASGAVLLLLLPPRRGARRVAGALGVVTVLVGGLTLSQHAFGWNLGIDTLLADVSDGFRAATSPGRMGPPACVSFVLLGTALLLAAAPEGSGRRRAGAGLSLVAGLPALISWMAYFYGADPLFSLPRLTGIAWQTTSILLCVAVSLALAVHEHGLGSLLRRPDPAGTMMRRLVPLTIALLLVTGWVEHRGERAGLYDAAFGNAVLTVARLVMFTAVLWWTARAMIAQILKQSTLETALSESQERFRVMVDSIPQLAWMARPDGWLFWYNRRWYDYTGATPEGMEGWGWQSAHDPAHLPRVVEHWKSSLAAGAPWQDIFPLRRADGEYRWFLSRAVPIRDERGRVVQWFGTNTDITEQRAAEIALRDASRIKDEFLATVSHELRTPMSAILGWCHILRRASGDRPPVTGEVAQGLEVIERNARLQAQIIEDLLDMSRILSGKVRLDVQSVNLGEIVAAAVDSIRPAAEAKGLRVRAVCDPLIRDIRGDPNRLQQVVYNLLSNAVKFTPRDGAVLVSCARVNSHVEVTVSDTGVGIRPEFLPHIFERFRQQDATTTRAFGGLGLGLSISKQLVELHGGTLLAASAGPGKGATFVVHLPVSVAVLPAPGGLEGAGRRHPATAWAGSEPPEDHTPGRLSGLSVLIVDDEPDAREMLSRMLERYGAKATAAGSAAEALDLLSREGPDLLLCDIGMPEMDGYGLIRALRQRPPEEGGRTPAIALTAFARSEDRTRSLRAGFQIHLSKPVEAPELLASIASLVGEGKPA